MGRPLTAGVDQERVNLALALGQRGVKLGDDLLVGLFLALVGGNLLPSGSLPDAFQVLALGTPNGWALVGFGRLSLLHDPTGDVIGPFFVLCLIAVITIGLAMIRVRRMVAP